jgi:hypothetical protein
MHMVPVARLRSSFEAKVLAARLGSEGVLYELRGNVDGIYPVGDVTVLVPEDELAMALEVLSGTGTWDLDDPEGVDDPEGTEQPGGASDSDDTDTVAPPSRPWTTRLAWRLAALLVLATLALLAARSFLLIQPA